jgi:SNF2 family DNA or RNA helicase
VIFAIHRDVIENMRVGLRQFGAVCLYGGTDPEKRQKNIDRFQNNPKCRVFIGNIHAAGTAITLTAAHHVTFIEQDWVPGNNAQAVMRCHRIGQENPVSVRFIVLDGTLDAKIGYILKRKTADLTHIFD